MPDLFVPELVSAAVIRSRLRGPAGAQHGKQGIRTCLAFEMVRSVLSGEERVCGFQCLRVFMAEQTVGDLESLLSRDSVRQPIRRRHAEFPVRGPRGI